MRRKLTLLKRAGKAGWAWARDTGDHIERVLTFYALLISSGGISATQVGWWGPAVAVFVFALVAVIAGGLNEWDRAAKYVETHGEYLRAMTTLQDQCFRHVELVERFLEAHKLIGPPEPTKYFTKSLRGGADAQQAAAERAALDAHERRTASEFLESGLLDKGIELFDRLVRLRLVVDTERGTIERPLTPHQILEGAQTIRIAAERAPILR
jgi:hypothetical protein